MLLAWKFLGALSPAGDSVSPVGSEREVQGTTVDVTDVDVLQYCGPDGPPSPYP